MAQRLVLDPLTIRNGGLASIAPPAPLASGCTAVAATAAALFATELGLLEISAFPLGLAVPSTFGTLRLCLTPVWPCCAVVVGDRPAVLILLLVLCRLKALDLTRDRIQPVLQLPRNRVIFRAVSGWSARRVSFHCLRRRDPCPLVMPLANIGEDRGKCCFEYPALIRPV